MMWMILQAEEAEDWVVEQPLLRCEFVRMSLLEVGVELEFKGEGVEKAFVKKRNNPDYQLAIGKKC
jgi:GDPmannose 4,6-dehydratase